MKYVIGQRVQLKGYWEEKCTNRACNQECFKATGTVKRFGAIYIYVKMDKPMPCATPDNCFLVIADEIEPEVKKDA